MSTRPSRQSTWGRKRGTPAQTERNNSRAKRARPNVDDGISAGPSRIVAEGPTTSTNQMTGEAIQLEDGPVTPLCRQGSHSATSSSVGETSPLTTRDGNSIWGSHAFKGQDQYPWSTAHGITAEISANPSNGSNLQRDPQQKCIE